MEAPAPSPEEFSVGLYKCSFAEPRTGSLELEIPTKLSDSFPTDGFHRIRFQRSLPQNPALRETSEDGRGEMVDTRAIDLPVDMSRHAANNTKPCELRQPWNGCTVAPSIKANLEPSVACHTRSFLLPLCDLGPRMPQSTRQISLREFSTARPCRRFCPATA